MSTAVQCLICGKLMKTRINGSHLLRAHGTTLNEYRKQFPDQDIGMRIPVNQTIVSMIDGKRRTLQQHSRNCSHNNLTPEQYYLKFGGEIKTCECGCGKQTTFNNSLVGYHRFCRGHGSLVDEQMSGTTTENIKKLFAENSYNASRIFKITYKKLWLDVVKNIPNCITDAEKIYKFIYPERGKCEICGNGCSFRSFPVGYKNTRGKKCALVKSSRKKYGVDNMFQSEVVKKKLRETCRKKYGFEHANQNSEQKLKTKNTKKLKYGDENYVNLEKFAATCMERYGVTNPNKLQTVKDKITTACLDRYGVRRYNNQKKISETCMKNYGVTSAMHVDEFMTSQQTSAFQLKEYIFPSGNIVKYQGYENFAIDKLLLDGLSEPDIILDKKLQPRIFYLYTGKKCRYYIDIFVKSLNKIIEVKSDWTYKLHEQRNLAKKEQCLKDGYNFEFWIFDKKKNLTIL